MRIRILRPAGGVLDGVKLSQLMPGSTYEISDSAAAHLITIGAAVEVPSTTPDPSVAAGEDDPPPVFGGITVTQPKDRAANTLRHGRRRRRK